jgi:hypothetical protein
LNDVEEFVDTVLKRAEIIPARRWLTEIDIECNSGAKS